MIWSRLKKSVESLFAPELKGRIELRSTNYRKAHDDVGRGYITVDGHEVWNMATLTFFKRERELIDAHVARTGSTPYEAQEAIEPDLAREGVFGQSFFYRSLEEYLNSSIDENLNSGNALRRALTMIDRRFGSRRIGAVDGSNEHPMVRYFLELRRAALSNGGANVRTTH